MKVVIVIFLISAITLTNGLPVYYSGITRDITNKIVNHVFLKIGTIMNVKQPLITAFITTFNPKLSHLFRSLNGLNTATTTEIATIPDDDDSTTDDFVSITESSKNYPPPLAQPTPTDYVIPSIPLQPEPIPQVPSTEYGVAKTQSSIVSIPLPTRYGIAELPPSSVPQIPPNQYGIGEPIPNVAHQYGSPSH